MKKVKFEVGKKYLYSYYSNIDGIEENDYFVVSCLDRKDDKVKLSVFSISGQFDCISSPYAMLNLASFFNAKNNWFVVDTSVNCGLTIDGEYYDGTVEYEFVRTYDGMLCSVDEYKEVK